MAKNKTENKETLMYVGGDPNQKDNDNSVPEWKKKWDKVVKGEATIAELGDVYTKGDIETLRTAPVGKVTGFSKTPDKMRVLVVHVGYDKAEMESDAFKTYMKRSKTELENLFGKQNINVGFHIPDEKTPTLTTAGFAHMCVADSQECAVLKRRLQEKSGAIDVVNIRVNPEVVGRDYFGIGGREATSTGPVKNKDGSYELKYKYLAEHELMHTISGNARKYNPTSFGDGYFRSLYDAESREIHKGNHLEFIPEDPNNKGKPIESGNKTMQKVLEKAKPEDKNVFMVDRDGTKTRLLLVNPEDNIMRGSWSNEKRTKGIKEGKYLTELHKIAINDVINDYLIGEKRRTADYTPEKPKLVVNSASKSKKTNTAVITAKKQRSMA